MTPAKAGDDWEFFAGLNATTEAYRTLKRARNRGPIAAEELEDFARMLLGITDHVQAMTSGEVNRKSRVHARARMALHHVLEWSFDKVPAEEAAWAKWYTSTLTTTLRLMQIAQRILVAEEELP